jgi:succinoglycan biosynthesis transport protein ExoP
VPAGECRGSPVHLLTSAAFTAFLRRAEADYDLVIVDSPPVLIGADAWLLACNAQATLMLARWGHTPPSAITAALKQFSDVRVKCLGVVMSLVDTSKHAQYDEAASLARSRQARRYYAKLVAPR